MVEQFEDQGTVARGFEHFNQLRDEAIVINLCSCFFVKAQVEEEPKGNLEQELVVAGDKSVKLLDDAKILHLVLVLSKDT